MHKQRGRHTNTRRTHKLPEGAAKREVTHHKNKELWANSTATTSGKGGEKWRRGRGVAKTHDQAHTQLGCYVGAETVHVRFSFVFRLLVLSLSDELPRRRLLPPPQPSPSLPTCRRMHAWHNQVDNVERKERLCAHTHTHTNTPKRKSTTPSQHFCRHAQDSAREWRERSERGNERETMKANLETLAKSRDREEGRGRGSAQRRTRTYTATSKGQKEEES